MDRYIKVWRTGQASHVQKYRRQIVEDQDLSFIRTIVKLADEIINLKSKAEKLKPGDSSSSNLESFKQELGISVSIAAEQLACFDIERIIPL